MATSRIQVTLDDDDLERVDAVRELHELSRTEVIAALVRDPMMSRVVTRYVRHRDGEAGR